MIEPHTLLEVIPETQIHPGARAAQRITWDSRQADEHTAFVALRGETAHGNSYIPQALERGAPFVLTDQAVERGVQVPDARAALRRWARAARDRYSAPVVGITGSAGKTTAKEYVGAALRAKYTSGNLNTLDAIACFLLENASAGATHGSPLPDNPQPTTHNPQPLVVEMGIDRIGEMAELMALVAPDIGVVTAIGEAHLEFFGSLEVIAREKGGILSARALGVVNARAGGWFPGVATYGLEGATFQPSALELLPSARMTYQETPVEVPSSSPVVLEAAVLGMAIAEQLRVSLPEAAARIAAVQVPGGRWKVLEMGSITLIDDTYNANPLSVRAALEGLSQFPGRRIAVLGDMLELGPEALRYHREVGERAAQVAERVYSVGEFRGALSEYPYPDADGLARALLSDLRPGDTVLFKASRGVRLERVLEKVLEGLKT